MFANRNSSFLVRGVWWHIAAFVAIATGATYFRGFQPEVVIGWIALVILSLTSLCVVYGVSKKRQAGGAFGLAALFVVASAFWRNGWIVSQSDLLDMAVGAAAFCTWLLALDARTGEPIPLISHVAGALTAVTMLFIAVMVTSGDSSQVHLLRVTLAIAILSALYDLSGPKWKVPLAIIAVVVIVFIVIRIAPTAA